MIKFICRIFYQQIKIVEKARNCFDCPINTTNKSINQLSVISYNPLYSFSIFYHIILVVCLLVGHTCIKFLKKSHHKSVSIFHMTIYPQRFLVIIWTHNLVFYPPVFICLTLPHTGVVWVSIKQDHMILLLKIFSKPTVWFTIIEDFKIKYIFSDRTYK